MIKYRCYFAHIPNRLLFCITAIFLLTACSTSTLEEASHSYKMNRDYTSLEIIYSNLAKGMKRSDIEHLLGESDYSPIDGQYYYSSNREEYPEDGDIDRGGVPIGLVVDYRNGQGMLTEELQTFWIGPIGE